MQVRKLIGLVAVAALSVTAGWAGTNSSAETSSADRNTVASSKALNTVASAFLFRNSGVLVSRSVQRVQPATRSMADISPPTQVQVARADAVAQGDRVAKAVKAVATAALAARKSRAAKAANEARSARSVAVQILAAEAAMNAKRARDSLLTAAGTGPFPSSAATVAAKKWAAAELTRMGYEPAQFSCLNQLWTRESGWNPRADNPASAAYGIPQSLPGAKMATAGPNWRTNPKTQMAWGLGYIKARYDNPCRAWAHSESDHWY